MMTYNFNNHIKLYYNIKEEKSTELSVHYEVRLYSEMAEFYKNYITDSKNSSISQIQGILERRDIKLNDIVQKDLFMVSLGLFNSFLKLNI